MKCIEKIVESIETSFYFNPLCMAPYVGSLFLLGIASFGDLDNNSKYQILTDSVLLMPLGIALSFITTITYKKIVKIIESEGEYELKKKSCNPFAKSFINRAIQCYRNTERKNKI